MSDQTRKRDAATATSEDLQVAATPTSILWRSVRSVRGMKYAVAVAGLAATVAVVSAFRLNYSVLVVGSLFTLGMMYVVLSFSRFSSQPAKLSRRLNAVLAWTFSILIVVVSALITTAISFGWPTALREALISSVLPHNEFWKVKVFDFKDQGESAERNRIGQRFSSIILDELANDEIHAFHGSGVGPISIVPQRGQSHEAADVTIYAQLAPAIVVSGYVHEALSENDYEFTVRVTAVSATGLEPLLIRNGRIGGDSSSMRQAAEAIARELTIVTHQYSREHPK